MKRLWKIIVGGSAACAVATIIGVSKYQVPSPSMLPPEKEAVKRTAMVDRHGYLLSTTYENRWNTSHAVPLHEVPPFLVRAFVFSEDRRFFEHTGFDCVAFAAAIADAARSFKIVRGGSTISEQAVRLVTPRRRTIFARTLEVFEARELERHFSKNQILEFYLNQVPFAARRRGVVEAARYLFDRDLSTLTEKEMLALVVMVRAPAVFDPRKYPQLVEARIAALLDRMRANDLVDDVELYRIRSQKLLVQAEKKPLEASHFVQYARSRTLREANKTNRIFTSLDANVQRRVQAIVNQRLLRLQDRNVHNAAVLAVDNRSGEILAWVNGGSFSSTDPGSQIDGVVTPRQPGSTLKPFLYALAFEKGWSPAEIILDSPLARPVSSGMHQFRNYSGTHYGPVTVRDALGNSLNIPAVRTVQAVGIVPFIKKLHALGFKSLDREPDFYGEGVALGAGEVTLFELVRAYMALANRGTWRDLKVVGNEKLEEKRQEFSTTTAALVADILSDSSARQLEFSNDSLLDLPVQTAIKTGTSTDYRDAWALGFSRNYTVGVWFGNLDRQSMNDVTGSSGPALVLRAAFSELERRSEPAPLPLSHDLRRLKICKVSGEIASHDCPKRDELFKVNQNPSKTCAGNHGDRLSQSSLGVSAAWNDKSLPAVRLPTPGLVIALDPRIPDELEALSLEMTGSPHEGEEVHWLVDDEMIGTSQDEYGRYLWTPKRGRHTVRASLVAAGRQVTSRPVAFIVK